ncbi:hypothetical protein [Streptococcus suis]|uniref:hypothetical protein n=1 Tax=Streptococcus suis TaxID=1307 RepID=UPI004038A111
MTRLLLPSSESYVSNLKDLYEKTLQNDVPVEIIIGDAAYSGKENIKLVRKENVHFVSKLNPSVSKGYRKEGDCFEHNKDAGLFVCPQRHMAVRKARTGKKHQNSNQVITQYFVVKNVSFALVKKAVIKKVHRLRPIPLRLRVMSIYFKNDFRKHLTSKKWQDTVTRLKSKMRN